MEKAVIITGGAKGIGKQIALDFKEKGYNVCITYNTSENEALELKKLGINIYKLDVTNEEDVNNIIDEISNKFNITCLVNNAGISEYSLLNEIDSDTFKNVIDTNLNSIYYITKKVLNTSMINNKYGTVINISSIWGVYGASMETVYSASKAGVIGFTRALAKEVAPCNIRVNAISPGAIKTDMIEKHLTYIEIQNLEEEILLGRLGKPKDISKVVLFLESEESSYITGQNLIVDGGMCL